MTQSSVQSNPINGALSSENFSQTFRSFQECVDLAMKTYQPLVFKAIITPADAQKILENNTNNRKMRMSHVEVLSEEMKKNRWQVNGDAIRLTHDLVLIDGQHRLQAALNANFTLHTVLFLNALNENFKTIDVGAKRTATDIVSIELENPKYASKITAAVTSLLRYQKYVRGEKSGLAVSNDNRQGHVIKIDEIRFGLNIPHEERLEFLKENPSFTTHVEECAKFHSSQRPTKIDFHVFASLKWLTDKIDPDTSHWFWNDVICQHKPKEEPKRGIYHLVDYLQKTKQRNHEKLNTTTMRHYSTIAYCWNMERQNKTLVKIPASFDKLVLFK